MAWTRRHHERRSGRKTADTVCRIGADRHSPIRQTPSGNFEAHELDAQDLVAAFPRPWSAYVPLLSVKNPPPASSARPRPCTAAGPVRKSTTPHPVTTATFASTAASTRCRSTEAMGSSRRNATSKYAASYADSRYSLAKRKSSASSCPNAIALPARLKWLEVTAVKHYYLSVNALKQPMELREDRSAYGVDKEAP